MLACVPRRQVAPAVQYVECGDVGSVGLGAHPILIGFQCRGSSATYRQAGNSELASAGNKRSLRLLQGSRQSVRRMTRLWQTSHPHGNVRRH